MNDTSIVISIYIRSETYFSSLTLLS